MNARYERLQIEKIMNWFLFNQIFTYVRNSTDCKTNIKQLQSDKESLKTQHIIYSTIHISHQPFGKDRTYEHVEPIQYITQYEYVEGNKDIYKNPDFIYGDLKAECIIRIHKDVFYTVVSTMINYSKLHNSNELYIMFNNVQFRLNIDFINKCTSLTNVNIDKIIYSEPIEEFVGVRDKLYTKMKIRKNFLSNIDDGHIDIKEVIFDELMKIWDELYTGIRDCISYDITIHRIKRRSIEYYDLAPPTSIIDDLLETVVNTIPYLKQSKVHNVDCFILGETK